MDLIISFLSTPAVLLGLVAMIGLLAQKKSMTEVLTGTFKTIIGFLVFSSGGSIMTGALQNFNTLFQKGFNIVGVVASPGRHCTSPNRICICDQLYIDSRLFDELSHCSNHAI